MFVLAHRENAVGDGQFFTGNDGNDARKCEGFRDVDVFDQGVGHG
jgi:hypothetical protein